MKKLRKYLLGGIALFLLLCFSAILLPADLFHQHQLSGAKSCKTVAGTQCKHKMHISTKSTFCWMCAIHFDKDFTTGAAVAGKSLNPVLQKYFSQYSLGFYQSAIVQRTLRGPPSA